jgi:uncharacterized protein YciI
MTVNSRGQEAGGSLNGTDRSNNNDRGHPVTYLQRLTTEGVAILVGRTLTTDQDSMGIVIFKARSDEEARALMNEDPAVSKGVMSAKLFPFRIALQAAANDPS